MLLHAVELYRHIAEHHFKLKLYLSSFYYPVLRAALSFSITHGQFIRQGF